jgi:ABC-2 type transport system permease protein
VTDRWPSTRSLVLEQTRYQVLTMLRSPVGMFFTIGLPTIMLVLFNALFGGSTIDTPAGEWSVRQFYTGGLAAFTAVSATYTNLVNVVPIRRDEGILKRWRSTPVPPGAYLAGWVLGALAIAAAGTGLQLLIGVVLYDLDIEVAKLPAMLVTFVVGVAAFAALGLAVAGLVPDADSAPAVANATILPLAFISDVFIAQDDPPRWLEVIGGIFPLKPFANAFQDTINPLVDAPAFGWSKLAVIVAWGIGGVLVARSTFSWEPATRGGSASRRRRRRSGAADGPDAAGLDQASA